MSGQAHNCDDLQLYGMRRPRPIVNLIAVGFSPS
jgi:hypothetical protein